MRVGAMTGQVGTGHGVPFHDGAEGTPAMNLMVHHDMTDRDKTSEALHARTSRVIPIRRMEWNATTWHDMRRHANDWERSPMIFCTARTRVYGCEEPTRKGQQGHYRPISALGTTSALRCYRVGQRPQGDTWDAFSWSTHTCFFSSLSRFACDTHSSWFQTVSEK